MGEDDGTFDPEDPVKCMVCEWTGRFRQTKEAPCPGGVTHACPSCEHRASMKRVSEDAIEETVETTQTTLGGVAVDGDE